MKAAHLHIWLVGLTLIPSYTAAALDRVPVAYRWVATSHQVPADILYAVALAESGTAYQGKRLPWPWALNIDGHGVFCESKNEALAKAADAIRQSQSVDIGLMQINWRWHQQRFDSLDQAIVPGVNLQVGALILSEQFGDTDDWWEAVGRYHDPGQDSASLDSAERYRQRVKQLWREVW